MATNISTIKRKTLIELASPALFGPGGKANTITLVAFKSANALAFHAIMLDTVANESFVVSDDAGKVRGFRDADDFLTQAGALSMIPNTLNVSFWDMDMVAPKAFTGDIIKKSESTVASYTKRKAVCAERLTKLQTELQLMAADPTVPASRRDENYAQTVAVQNLSAYLQAEIDRINAILHP